MLHLVLFINLQLKKEAINPENLIINKKRIKLPFTLIGGINHNNIQKLNYLRPNNVAVVSSVWDYKTGPGVLQFYLEKL